MTIHLMLHFASFFFTLYQSKSMGDILISVLYICKTKFNEVSTLSNSCWINYIFLILRVRMYNQNIWGILLQYYLESAIISPIVSSDCGGQETIKNCILFCKCHRMTMISFCIIIFEERSRKLKNLIMNNI